MATNTTKSSNVQETNSEKETDEQTGTSTVWTIREDGYLNAQLTDVHRIAYHPPLNVVLAASRRGLVRVVDVNSGVVLHTSNLSSKSVDEEDIEEPITCRYVPGLDRVLFCDGRSMGIRSDYNGVLLLDTVLQRPVTSSKDVCKLELLLSEAVILKQCLTNVAPSKEHVINELTERIGAAQKESRKGIKAQKWNTVCLELPLEMLRAATTFSITELLATNRHTPELVVASAVHERLTDLVEVPVDDDRDDDEESIRPSAHDRRTMASEARRRETFAHWPHMDYKWALPDQMAQAGFYHQPNASGDDRAMCFTCSVCLVCWERTDEPWSEHERHSPNCPFVMGEYTQNVPLAVTRATNAAVDVTYRDSAAIVVGESAIPHLVATANGDGLVTVYDVTGKPRSTHSFYVTHYDCHLLDKFTLDFGVPGMWTTTNAGEDEEDDDKRPSVKKRITALCIINAAQSATRAQSGSANNANNDASGTTITRYNLKNKSNNNNNANAKTNASCQSLPQRSPRPALICGLSIRCRTTTRSRYHHHRRRGRRREDEADAVHDANKRVKKETRTTDETERMHEEDKERVDEVKMDVDQPLELKERHRSYLVVYDYAYDKQSEADSSMTLFNEHDEQKRSIRNEQLLVLLNEDEEELIALEGVDQDGDEAVQEPHQADDSTDAKADDDTPWSSESSVLPPLIAEDELYEQMQTIKKEYERLKREHEATGSQPQENRVAVYQNLIPGESDAIYLPPPTTITAATTPPEKEKKESTDSRKKRNANGSVEDSRSAKSISDHIAELRTSLGRPTNRRKQLGYSRAVQCIELSDRYKRHAYEIARVAATPDDRYVVVVLTRDAKTANGTLTDDEDEESADGCNDMPSAVLAVYALETVGNALKLNEQPSGTREFFGRQRPLEMAILPRVQQRLGEQRRRGAASQAKGKRSRCATETEACDEERTKAANKDADDEDVAGADVPASGLCALVCEDGAVRVLDLCTLNTVATVTPNAAEGGDVEEKEKFVSAIYCNSLERLCAATANGSLHFYAINNTDAYSNDDHDDEDPIVPHRAPPTVTDQQQPGQIPNDTASTTSATHQTAADCIETNKPNMKRSDDRFDDDDMDEDRFDDSLFDRYFVDNDYDTPPSRDYSTPPIIPLADILMLRDLIICEPFKYIYSVAVPSCWSEMLQAQRQRRLPQHVNAENDVDRYTRTWRLQTDTMTWDEHVFELMLPQSILLSHVNVRYAIHRPSGTNSTNPPSTIPRVEMTLLRQRSGNSIGRTSVINKNVVDEAIRFQAFLNRNNIEDEDDDRLSKESIDETILHTSDDESCYEHNPVTTQEYLRSCNSEILAGPIDISQGFDPTDWSGMLTMTCPRMYRSKCRTLLLHLKGLRAAGRKRNDGNETLDYMGCDCLHEVSVTLYCTRGAATADGFLLQEGRRLRGAMLESRGFVESLVATATTDVVSIEQRSIALDILNWIAATRLVRNRSHVLESRIAAAPPYQADFLARFKFRTYELLRTCVLFGTRSEANKVVKLMIACSSGSRNIEDRMRTWFDDHLLAGILHVLHDVERIRSASALHSLALLLYRVAKGSDRERDVADLCLRLLTHVAAEIERRVDPYHATLRSRFGLYGTPLEAELFDIEASVQGASAHSNNFHQLYAFNKECLDAREVMSSATAESSAIKMRNVASSRPIRGLLETVPLHFTCVASSDGTRLERSDATIGTGSVNFVPATYAHAGGTHPAATTSATSSVGTKKIDIMANAENQLCEEFWHSTGKFIKFTEALGTGSGTASTSGNTLQSSAAATAAAAVTSVDSVYQMIINADSLKNEDFAKLITDISDLTSYCQSGSADATSKRAVKRAEEILSPTNFMPWSQLLTAPAPQSIVVERMHSGARRYVTLDFGQAVLLTDVHIPSSYELVSIAVDVWLEGEEIDGTRLAVTSDIATRSLALNDLQPPPLCRYARLTMIGRYGMSTTRCRIPAGQYYGHLLVLTRRHREESGYDGRSGITTPDHRDTLSILFEDVSCRYALACSKLKESLDACIEADTTAHGNANTDRNANNTADTARILNAYQEAITYQRQLNIVRNVMYNSEVATYSSYDVENLFNYDDDDDAEANGSDDIPLDKLRSVAECLLEALLANDQVPHVDADTCNLLFNGLCVTERSRVQFLAAIFLDRSCRHMSRFWGDFIPDTLRTMYGSGYARSPRRAFPRDRLFVLLAFMARRYAAATTSDRYGTAVFDGTLRVIAECLLPLSNATIRQRHLVDDEQYFGNDDEAILLASAIDLPLLSWLMLFLSLQLDDVAVRPVSNRWDWVTGEMDKERAAGRPDVAEGGPRVTLNNGGTRKKKIHKLVQGKKKLSSSGSGGGGSSSTTESDINNLIEDANETFSMLNSLTNKIDSSLIKNKSYILSKIHDDLIKMAPVLECNPHADDATSETTTTSGTKSSSGKRRWLDGKESGSTNSSGSTNRTDDRRHTTLPQRHHHQRYCRVQIEHCRIVCKALYTFLLRADHTCTPDIYLLACKAIGRLTRYARLPLGSLINVDGLSNLIDACVRAEMQWMRYALVCLLRDAVESDDRPDERQSQKRADNNELNMMERRSWRYVPRTNLEPLNEVYEEPEEEGTAAGGSVSAYDYTPETISGANKLLADAKAVTTPSTSSSAAMMMNVYETDDSEDLSDFLDDILERGRLVLKKPSMTNIKTGTHQSYQHLSHLAYTASSAYDARVESSIDIVAEVTIKRLTMSYTQHLARTVLDISTIENPDTDDAAQSSTSTTNATSSSWPNELFERWLSPLDHNVIDSNWDALAVCFDRCLQVLPRCGADVVERTLQLFLTLAYGTVLSTTNITFCSIDRFDPDVVPRIRLSGESVRSIIEAIACSRRQSLDCWTSAIQVLTLACNIATQEETDAAPKYHLVSHIINHPNFELFFVRLLSGSGIACADRGLAGPSLCRSLQDLLMRLQMRCDVVRPSNVEGGKLKTAFLSIVHQLVRADGPLMNRNGPLDAQSELLQSMSYLSYVNADLSVVMSVIHSTAILINDRASNVERVRCLNIGERPTPTVPSAGGASASSSATSIVNSLNLFASVLSGFDAETIAAGGGGISTNNHNNANIDTQQCDRIVTWDTLLITLLTLIANIVQTPLPDISKQDTRDASPMETDMYPNEREYNDDREIREEEEYDEAPCLADTVLEHRTIVVHLCRALAACRTPSISMVANMSLTNKTVYGDLAEPSGVGDAVFNLLASLTRRSSQKCKVLVPLLSYLSDTRHDTIQALSEPLVWFALHVLDNLAALRHFVYRIDGIKILCANLVRACDDAYLSSVASTGGTASTIVQRLSGNETRSDAGTAIAGSSSAKKSQQAHYENAMSLVNYAPYGSIRCRSVTAQPADVLLQGGTHRRARTPQWSYHFYHDEAHTELTVQLPHAILLHEVHLQPHVGALATCPSAVALEISADGPSRLAATGPPLFTSGMTFIRLNLPSPQTVNCLRLRLYKPRDTNHIGLSQVRVLGTTAFGGIARARSQTDDNNKNGTGENDEDCCKNAFGWIRLLDRCVTLAAGGQSDGDRAEDGGSGNTELMSAVLWRAIHVPRLLRTLCSLMLVPSQATAACMTVSVNVENIVRALILHDRETGECAIRLLLRYKRRTNELQQHNDHQRTVCDLLYRVCTHRDSDVAYRVWILFDWLRDATERALQREGDVYCDVTPAYVSCIARVVRSVANDNDALATACRNAATVDDDLFDALYRLTEASRNDRTLKRSLDTLWHALCYRNIRIFTRLLMRMKALIPPQTGNKEDDEAPQAFYRAAVPLELSDDQLDTIAAVIRSPKAARNLLRTGVPRALCDTVVDHCRGSMSQRSSIAKAALRFFARACDVKPMRDWIATYETDRGFWKTILLHLSTRNDYIGGAASDGKLKSELLADLEETCVRFLAKCCLCHERNQTLLSRVLRDLIGRRRRGIDAFMRRLILQLLLETEKAPVSVLVTDKTTNNGWNPHYYRNYAEFDEEENGAIIYLGTNVTLADIYERYISGTKRHAQNDAAGASNKKDRLDFKSLYAMALADSDHLSLSAGVTAKDKRAKDARNQNIAYPTMPKLKKIRYASNSNGNQTSVTKDVDDKVIRCDVLPYDRLPLDLTVGQVLTLVERERGQSDEWPLLRLTVIRPVTNDNPTALDPDEELFRCGTYGASTLTTGISAVKCTLQVFSAMDGLSLLAQHLPTVYAESIAHAGGTRGNGRHGASTSSDRHSDHSDWVKVCEVNEDIYEDIDIDSATGANGPTAGTSGNGCGTSRGSTSGAIPNVPPHSLAAFALFLRLPGYADHLLLDMKKALCLLRLVLGVTDDGDGVDIFQTPVADSLPTLPFEVLKNVYDATPLTTCDSLDIRRISIDLGVVHLLLACLGIFTHQTPVANNSSDGNTASTSKMDTGSTRGKDDRGQSYWAKGTGFGTGSTQQSWNVEQALMKQRSEEEHVTVLLLVLSSYINPLCGFNNRNRETTAPSDVRDEDVRNGGDRPRVSRLPRIFLRFLADSALIPALSSYLRNDSVLDMARHIPLYRAALQLLRAIALDPQLVSLLVPEKKHHVGSKSHCRKRKIKRMRKSGSRRSDDGSDISNGSPSIAALLMNMKRCVDTYASKLRFNRRNERRAKKDAASSMEGNAQRGTRYEEDEDDDDDSDVFVVHEDETENYERDEGLATLIPDIQRTARLVRDATERYYASAYERRTSNEDAGSVNDGDNEEVTTTDPYSAPSDQNVTAEARYLKVMKSLQFDTFEMIREMKDGKGGYKFVVSHNFETMARASGDGAHLHPARMKRLAQESVTLATSLPLSYGSSVFVRCDTDRLDVMKVLITGPSDTPYANGCFVFDVYFPPEYPQVPMLINLETTGRHTVRFNPNLYNDGKVCLSVLNTWHGRPEEKWNAQTSSFLQVLVSIQSLILVPEPYFNEPGYERSRGTPSGTQSSRDYNANICHATARWAMLEQIVDPCPCFRDVIRTHFYLKRDEICGQIERWIDEQKRFLLQQQQSDNLSFYADQHASGSGTAAALKAKSSINLTATSGGTKNSKRTSYTSVDALKKIYEQLQERLYALEPPESCAPKVDESDNDEDSDGGKQYYEKATAQNDGNEEDDEDDDIDMEKMVEDVCN